MKSVYVPSLTSKAVLSLAISIFDRFPRIYCHFQVIMSIDRCSKGISCEDQRIIRLFKITKSEFRHVLHLVFQWGCKKEPNETLQHYLTKKKGMSNRDFKNRFDSQMRETINTDPLGKTYDVSLLWACIRWGCDDLAQAHDGWHEGDDRLESLITTVKNYRNRLIHLDIRMCDDAAMNTWWSDAITVLEKLLISAGHKYSIPDHDVKKAVEDTKEQIDKIVNAPLGDLDPVVLHEQMLKLRADQRNTVTIHGKSELSERYKNLSKIDPASFVTGKERLNVKNVFTKLEVIYENKAASLDETYDVEYNELLQVKTQESEEPVIIIVEGDAGAGKTTLTKLILSDWAEGKTIFKGLENYDLVLRAEGKNKLISSYLELIQVLMPKASYQFADDDLIRSILQLKVLLVMDGFDELNVESEKLIRELSDKQIPGSSGKLQLLITTRPSKLSDLLNIVKPHSIVQTKLKGISVHKRVEFVSKLHDEMIKEKQSKQETQKLIDLMKQSQSRLGEHYRLPLNLTLLTYLWASDPSKVNPETTVTGLYIAFVELLQSRLLVRLQDHVGVADLPKDKCEELMGEFLEELYKVSLDTLSSGFMQLSDQSTKTLKEKCGKLNLPFNDMTEAFLVVEKEWTSTGYKTDLTVPHKSIMEFYSAKQFMKHIKNMNGTSSHKAEVMSHLEKIDVPEAKKEQIQTIINKYSTPEDTKLLKKICCKLFKTDTDLTMYENMFLHLTGLLAHQCPSRLQEYAEELVELLMNAGFQGTKWLDVLVEAKCNEKLAALFAPFYSGLLTVRDGHTGAALVLFKHLETNTPVKIILENEVSYIPHLDDMLLQLSKRDCDVELFLKHQWKHQEYGFSDDRLQDLLHGKDGDHQCRVSRFTGHLKTLSHLPESLKKLCITFATNEHAQQLLKELADLVENNYIEYLGIHVMPNVQPDGLSPLPVVKVKNKECGNLWLSNVADDWEAKCDVIRALLPQDGMFNSLMFPQSNLSASQCGKLINELSKLKVKVNQKGGVRFSSSNINKNQLINLKKQTREQLGCELQCMDESTIW